MMKLFGGGIAWRANKQDIVTTSSTKAEFLAILQTAKKTIYLSIYEVSNAYPSQSTHNLI